MQRIRAGNPATLFLLAGDTISPSVASTLLRGEQMIAGLNAVGLDLATFGNHEFDFGPAVLGERMRESAFPWTSANVLDHRSGRPFGGASPAVALTLAGVRVGLFGLTTADTARSSSPGPDVDIREPLAATADVDVVLGGHEHEPLVAEEGGALITKAGSDARYLVEVDLWFGTDGRLRERSWTFHEVSARLPDDPRVAALVRSYAERLGRELDVVVGHTTVPLEARRTPLRTRESNLADFVADAMRTRLRTDVALLNGGGIRSDRIMPAGPLTRRDVAALLPFGNVVVTLELTGRELREALEQGMSRLEREGGGFLQVSGLALTFDPSRPAGQRVVALEIAGAALDPQRRYTAAVVDYVANGGDGVTAFRTARVTTDAASGPLLADVLLQAVASRGTISPQVDGRLRAVAR